jgi:hypothetical protein
MKTNFKFIGVALFAVTFLISGFSINPTKIEAASVVQSFGTTYSISSIITTTNSDKSITTKILVGCAHSSGDKYDVNTGRACNNNIKTALIGCAIGSKDIYDINTGRACATYIKPVLVGCGIKSRDLYDINTGNSCKNILINKSSNTVTGEVSVQVNSTKSAEKEALSINNLNKPSGRELLKNSLTASVVKAGSVLKGPMSIWVILLIIVILLSGGYGVYSFINKDKKIEVKPEITKKPEPITPKTTPTQTPVTPIKPEAPITPNPINTNPVQQGPTVNK